MAMKPGPNARGGALEAPRPFLEVQGISLSFDGIRALDNVNFNVAERSRCGLIGPNGAGKTTLFNCVSRLYSAQSGRIIMDGQDLSTIPGHAIVGIGAARTFQNVGLIQSMSVFDNVMGGAWSEYPHGLIRFALIPPELSASEKVVRSRAWEVLERLDMTNIASLKPSELPYGTQKRVELARALMMRPRLLMLDEPANGLTTVEVDELRVLLTRLWEEYELTLLVVEHNMRFVMNICDDIVVLDAGKVIAHGSPEEVRNNPAVIEAYLGRRNPVGGIDNESSHGH